MAFRRNPLCHGLMKLFFCPSSNTRFFVWCNIGHIESTEGCRHGEATSKWFAFFFHSCVGMTSNAVACFCEVFTMFHYISVWSSRIDSRISRIIELDLHSCCHFFNVCRYVDHGIDSIHRDYHKH